MKSPNPRNKPIPLSIKCDLMVEEVYILYAKIRKNRNITPLSTNRLRHATTLYVFFTFITYRCLLRTATHVRYYQSTAPVFLRLSLSCLHQSRPFSSSSGLHSGYSDAEPRQTWLRTICARSISTGDSRLCIDHHGVNSRRPAIRLRDTLRRFTHLPNYRQLAVR